MGGSGSKVRTGAGAAAASLFVSRKANIIVVGIDGAGKSTIINHLKPPSEQSLELPPTVGCKVEQVKRGKVAFTVFDMAGGSKYRNMWSNYYREAEAVIFVIDAADVIRMAVSKEELDEMLGDPAMKSRSVPLLFLANKCDLPHRLAPQEISERMALSSIKGHPWQIAPCNGLTGDGVGEAMDWISEQLAKKGA